MHNLRKAISIYQPFNKQEAIDQQIMLGYIDTFGERTLYPQCAETHFTVSAFIFNINHTKVLMYEDILNKSISCIGNHSNGEPDLFSIVKREIHKRTGLYWYLGKPEIASLTSLQIPGQMQNGVYVFPHRHLEVIYIFEANENDLLTQYSPRENINFSWLTFYEMYAKTNDLWKLENVYKKIIKQYA